MKISIKGFTAIARFEGYRQQAYRCPSGVWTIGYGHTEGVKKGDTISYREATDLLHKDIEKSEKVVEQCGGLTQGQFDALVSFVFNVGETNFNNSTLKEKVLNNRYDKTIGDEFRKWVFSKGRKLEGLVKRRDWEARRYYENN